MELNLDNIAVKHHEQAQRFEAEIGNMRALVTYRRTPGRITFLHTEVPSPLEGQGLAAKLVRTALDFARAQHLQVVPLCPYVSSFIRKNSEYQDLVPTDQLQKIVSR
ncbi:MAG TPA: GNAT family N-acetyltransferase [Candidatus Acidoferrum sp.]|nr:GNAT family N-acetyltransferase [Candidatus Acidoferrum sp.]